jgi:hypothetical protein
VIDLAAIILAYFVRAKVCNKKQIEMREQNEDMALAFPVVGKLTLVASRPLTRDLACCSFKITKGRPYSSVHYTWNQK